MRIYILLLFALMLVACGMPGSGQAKHTTTSPDDQAFATLAARYVSFNEAESTLRMKLVLPSYVTRGLAAPQEAALIFGGSRPVGAELAYQLNGAIPENEAVIASFVVDEWKSTGYGKKTASEKVDISGVTVSIGQLPNVLEGAVYSTSWENDGRSFQIDVIGLKGISSEQVRAETLKVTQSMFD